MVISVSLLLPRPRFGANYIDSLSGALCEIHHPGLRADLWRDYFDRDADADAIGFALVRVRGDVVGGVWFREHPGSDGDIIEARGAWVNDGVARRSVADLSVHALKFFDAQAVVIVHEGAFATESPHTQGEVFSATLEGTLVSAGVPDSSWEERIRLLRQWDLMARSYIGPSTDEVVRTQVWRPIILDPTRYCDRAVYDTLRDGNSFDLIRSLKTPAQPRWVVYPWRRVIVESGLGLDLRPSGHKISTDDRSRIESRTVGIADPRLSDLCVLIASDRLSGRLLISSDEVRPLTGGGDGVSEAVHSARLVAEANPYLDVEIVPLDDVLIASDLVVTTPAYPVTTNAPLGTLIVDAAHGSIDVVHPSDDAEARFERRPNWPTLASESANAAAVAATTLRHLALGYGLPSGRLHLRLDETAGDVVPFPSPSPLTRS